MTKVINLYGGPGTGKSTLACDLFVRLKRKGVTVELVREYVKDWAYEHRKVGQYDQIYIAGKQAHKETTLYGKVDYIITDSPLLLAPFYQQKYQNMSFVYPAIQGLMEFAAANGVEYYHFLLKRFKPYQQVGRYETEEQAKQIDEELKDFLTTITPPVHFVTCPDEEKADHILNILGL